MDKDYLIKTFESLSYEHQPAVLELVSHYEETNALLGFTSATMEEMEEMWKRLLRAGAYHLGTFMLYQLVYLERQQNKRELPSPK